MSLKIVKKKNYYPQIDGLRCLAIVLVILYHARFEINDNLLFKSGFLGVDIFFVISGFLITSIIKKEIGENKKFNFFNFYERRIRRLLPVLVLVVLTISPISFYFMFGSQFIEFINSILGSIFFYSNFYFHYIGQLYQAESGLFKPFLHTWSLAVEEQFYLLFPLFLIISYKLFENKTLIFFILILILSLFFAHWASQTHPSFNFYFLPSRIWELLAGSLIALMGKENNIKASIKNIYLSKLGFFFILAPTFFFNDRTIHPSFFTSSVIFGCAIFIFYSHKDEFLTRILSNKILVYIGLISYSLYLWHYPIFSLYRVNIINDQSSIVILSLIFLSIILSITSYEYVEIPFRNTKIIETRKFIKLIIISIIFISLVCLFIINNKDLIYKRSLIEHINYDNGYYIKEYRNYKELVKNPEFKSNDKNKVLIMGDSHSQDFFHALYLNKEIFEKYEFSHYSDIKVYCIKKFILQKKDCKNKKQEKMYELLKKSNTIILSLHWDKKDLKYLDEAVRLFKDLDKDVIISSNKIEFLTYNFKTNKITYLDNYLLREKKLPYLQNIEYLEGLFFNQQRDKEIIKEINIFLEEFSKKKKLKFLNKSDYQCELNNQKCDLLTDKNYKIYWDYGHTTIEGARYFGKKIKKLNWF